MVGLSHSTFYFRLHVSLASASDSKGFGGTLQDSWRHNRCCLSFNLSRRLDPHVIGDRFTLAICLPSRFCVAMAINYPSCWSASLGRSQPVLSHRFSQNLKISYKRMEICASTVNSAQEVSVMLIICNLNDSSSNFSTEFRMHAWSKQQHQRRCLT